jgi:hypothetical protein
MLNGHRKNSVAAATDAKTDGAAVPPEGGVDPGFLAEIQEYTNGYVSGTSPASTAPPREGEPPAVLLRRLRKLASS